MKCEIIKILAYGSWRRYVWIRFSGEGNDFIKCWLIDEAMYQFFKKNGVPTSQSLSRRK